VRPKPEGPNSRSAHSGQNTGRPSSTSEVGTPLVGGVLVVARLAAALGADEITHSDHHARLIVVASCLVADSAKAG
jgi:hypothetical protein